MNYRNHAKIKLNHPTLCRGDFYLNCGDGWYQLIDEMLTEIEKVRGQLMPRLAYIEPNKGRMKAVVDGMNAEIQDIIDAYEYRSQRICEGCGGKGQPRSGWIMAACNDCR